jgi:4-carboxymuconolactone decarboxylase
LRACNRIIAKLAVRQRPGEMTTEQADLFDFVSELLQTGQASDAAFERVNTRWGPRGAADLLVLVGYYIMLCHVYNVSQFSLPQAATPFHV